MDKYNKNRFEKKKKQYAKNPEISEWNELYARLHDGLLALNDNELERERIRTEAIVECAKQYKENISLTYALPVVSLILSVIATILSFSAEHLPSIFTLQIFGIASVLTIMTILITTVIMRCTNNCQKRRDDLIYYQMQLSIINSILAERQSKTNQPHFATYY